MSIAILCDGCPARVLQAGPNTGAVTVPDGWVQIQIEQKQRATLVQHQCPRCYQATKEALAEHTRRLMPEVTNPVGGKLNWEKGD